ncbi:hypothetical protein TRVA0_013S00562 [Trichomonascus vanleenenianus]|uniref:uncharacterized protein n=1 Tax=Trichomonascus vanleenenianus TaxID=2268995 RepID=UPI003ECAB54E
MQLPPEIWLIVLQYLREYEYNLDSQLWRVRSVCKMLARLADSLIWSQVTVQLNRNICEPVLKFATLFDAVQCALDQHSSALSFVRSTLNQIKINVGKAELEKRYEVYHNIYSALRLAPSSTSDSALNNRLLQALLSWKDNNNTNIDDIITALIAPYDGYAIPNHYSNEIDSSNIRQGIQIIRRKFCYIKHVQLSIYRGITDNPDTLALFVEILNGIAENSRLQSLDVIGNFSNRFPVIRALQSFSKNPLQRLIINEDNVLVPGSDIAQALNELPSCTELTVKTTVKSEGPVANLTANLAELVIKYGLSIARLKEVISPYESLARLVFVMRNMSGKIQLPDSVTHLEAIGGYGFTVDRDFAMSSNFLKSLTLTAAIFLPNAYLFPSLEHLAISGGKVQVIEWHPAAPYPMLQTLECGELPDGNDEVLQLLELARPLQKFTLTLIGFSKHDKLYARLLFSKCLPPIVAVELDPKSILSQLYFVQRLLARPSVSDVHIIRRHTFMNIPPVLDYIPLNCRRLVACTHQGRFDFSDTHALHIDFIDVPLGPIDDELKRLLASR